MLEEPSPLTPLPEGEGNSCSLALWERVGVRVNVPTVLFGRDIHVEEVQSFEPARAFLASDSLVEQQVL